MKETPDAFPPVAGLWRRFTAWLIDALLVGLAGQLIAAVFAPSLYTTGPYGRLVGLAVILLYFGILNSSIGGGQTVGKRLARIAVRGADNRPISLLRSLLRAAIPAAPLILGGWAIPLYQNRVIAGLAGVVTVGVGGALLYTLIFNDGPRQGLHDLLCRTYVVKPDGEPQAAFPKTAYIHKLLSATWVGLTVIVMFLLSLNGPADMAKPSAAAMESIGRELRADPRYFTVDVRDQTITPENDTPYRALVVEVWTVGQLPDDQRWETGKSIAGLVMKELKGAKEFDQIQVNVTYGYDISIASYRSGFWYSNPVDEWTSILAGE